MNMMKKLFLPLSKVSKSVILIILEDKNVFVHIIIPYLLFVILNISLASIGHIGFLLLTLMDILVCVLLCDNSSKRDEVIKNAVEVSMKDERLKTDLITNVSHDLKTPLTSIINYVELIKREDTENERIRRYVEILENKSFKLKKLTEDLLEASKITSGNIKVELVRIDLVELINQTIGEFYEKFEGSDLTPVFRHDMPEAFIMADPSHLWRVIENLFGNACKYALPGTKLSITLTSRDKKITLLISNVSRTNIGLEDYEFEERFTRGDASRSTEGTGLGLAIAKSLANAQNAEFNVSTSGDLFKCFIAFKNP